MTAFGEVNPVERSHATRRLRDSRKWTMRRSGSAGIEVCGVSAENGLWSQTQVCQCGFKSRRPTPFL